MRPSSAIARSISGEKGWPVLMRTQLLRPENQLIGPDHKVARGSIGIEFNAQPSPAIQRVYGVGTGVTISNVIAGSPAEQAGLKVGDTIIAVDGKEVKSGDELVAEIAGRKPGSKAKVGYVRNGKKDETTVTVAERSKLFASRL